MLVILAILATGCASPPEPRDATALDLGGDRPPVIILDIDTLRADHLGAYGYHRATSQHMDALAAEGVRFEWAFSQAPNTPPSQTSILTSLYPSTHGMIEDQDRVPQAATTLAEAFHAGGWKTAGFVDGGYMSAMFGHDQGFDIYDDSRGGGLAAIGPKVIDYVRAHADEPFFLLVHTYDTHSPYDAREGYGQFLEGLEPPTPGFVASSEYLEEIRKSVWTDEPKTLPPNDMEWAKALYDGEIAFVDDWIGSFLAELETLGLDERAIVVLISDHGEEFGEHGSVLHEKLYATVTRIPLIFRLPPTYEDVLDVSPGQVVDDLVETIDVMPTLLDLVGLPIPAIAEGRSLLPLFRGGDRPPYRAISESPFFGTRRAIALGDRRLFWTVSTDEVELYAFRDDPLEQVDLAEQEPDTAARLRNALVNWQKTIDEIGGFDEAGGALDPAIIEQLRALGYIQ
ncbi:MAG: sulfatase [Acidobacteriota bacterium]